MNVYMATKHQIGYPEDVVIIGVYTKREDAMGRADQHNHEGTAILEWNEWYDEGQPLYYATGWKYHYLVRRLPLNTIIGEGARIPYELLGHLIVQQTV